MKLKKKTKDRSADPQKLDFPTAKESEKLEKRRDSEKTKREKTASKRKQQPFEKKVASGHHS